jgi:hypothetical protein
MSNKNFGHNGLGRGAGEPLKIRSAPHLEKQFVRIDGNRDDIFGPVREIVADYNGVN